MVQLEIALLRYILYQQLYLQKKKIKIDPWLNIVQTNDKSSDVFEEDDLPLPRKNFRMAFRLGSEIEVQSDLVLLLLASSDEPWFLARN
ncbi:hypothetical protein H5410_015599 [Solanum commersonii]|uniref:Uncharacterized protein n=1 Tax=Solanum commersonii TaxID=4109 RepID=A0A9J5ZV04_SOLCO|nr:hypothetical protein H5410_015599 [Solanum commersonii]